MILRIITIDAMEECRTQEDGSIFLLEDNVEHMTLRVRDSFPKANTCNLIRSLNFYFLYIKEYQCIKTLQIVFEKINL